MNAALRFPAREASRPCEPARPPASAVLGRPKACAREAESSLPSERYLRGFVVRLLNTCERPVRLGGGCAGWPRGLLVLTLATDGE